MRAIAEGVWETRNEVWMPGRVCFDGRMTVLRLADGGLLLHSPNPLGPEHVAELSELGEVRHIVAPNLVHHLFAAAAKATFPQATLWGAPGLREKVGLAVDEVLGESFPDPAVQAISLPSGPRLNETVFLHRPSRTLVVTDLVFNVQQPRGWGTHLVMHIVGCHRCLSASRSLKWVFVRNDLPGFAAASRALAELDWDRLVMAHGDVVEDGGRAALLEGLAWLP